MEIAPRPGLYDGPVDPLTESIIGAAIAVSRAVGPGLLESAYEEFLSYEIVKREHAVSRQVSLPATYQGVRVDIGFRPDIVVDNAVILELKTVEKLLAVHEAQLLTYMRLSAIRTGLLINFNGVPVTKGIRRLSL